MHAHVGWTLSRRRPDMEKYCRHLRDDRVLAFVDRTSLLWFGGGLLLPGLIDGWQGFLWGGLVRMALLNHAMFAVNSIGHAFGVAAVRHHDRSRNSLPIALLSLGEGWHNNHHAFPSAAAHGMGWRQPDHQRAGDRGCWPAPGWSGTCGAMPAEALERPSPAVGRPSGADGR